MTLIAACYPGQPPPYTSVEDLHDTIDSITVGDVEWRCFEVSYAGDLPAGDVPSWMTTAFQVWFRCPKKVVEAQLANKEFCGNIDWTPKRRYNKHGHRVYRDLMSGDWAWEQAVSPTS